MPIEFVVAQPNRYWLGWYKLAAWQRKRTAQLSAEPLCRMCLEQEIVEPANTVDHIVPHRGDPELFWGGELQSLCATCHSRHKQNEEIGKTVIRFGPDGWPIETPHLKRHGFSIPHGLEESAIPVVVVCGPSGSGKTTYVRQHADHGDIIIDLDDLLVKSGGRRWDSDKTKLKIAFAKRDNLLHSLHREYGRAAWFIVSAPRLVERKAWLKALGDRASVVVINTAPDVCKARISADPDRAHAAERLKSVVDHWWRQYD